MDIRGFYGSEAKASLAAMRVAAGSDEPDTGEILRCARLLRGSALLAGDEQVHQVASAFVAGLADESVTSQPDFRERLAATLEDLEALVFGGVGEPAVDGRARSARERWGGDPIHPPDTEEEDDSMGFVAREAGAIAETMDEAVTAFQSNPRDRAWLNTVRQRQRTLLGSVHVDDMPIVGESLRAVDDLTGLVLRLDAPVKAEWLDVYRAGRDVLRSANEALLRGEIPAPMPALSRLRTLHDELMSRYMARDDGQEGTRFSGEAGIALEETADADPTPGVMDE